MPQKNKRVHSLIDQQQKTASIDSTACALETLLLRYSQCNNYYWPIKESPKHLKKRNNLKHYQKIKRYRVNIIKKEKKIRLQNNAKGKVEFFF